MQKALFLDRDGVVNVEKDYLYKIEDFEFIEGIFDLCRHYASLGYLLFIVTNQSGIARGYYSQEQYNEVTRWMVDAFAKEGVEIAKVYHCPHHPRVTGACSCRKPKSGMLLQAQEEFAIDLEHSIIIGDKERDIEAGLNAGLKETYLFDPDQTVSSSKASKIVSTLDAVWKQTC
jgi:D-glycero-D-manno-heptose 1,7-bisphosphate phosphatase